MKAIILCCLWAVGSWALDSFPKIAVNGNGEAIAVWEANVMGATTIQAARFDGSWAAATSISDPNSRHPDIAINSDGEIVGTWESYTQNEGNFQIDSALSAMGGVFTHKTIPMQTTNDTYSKVVLDSSGNGVAVWQGGGTVFGSSFMDGTWDAPYPVSSSTLGFPQPRLAIDPMSGDAIAIWQRFVGLSRQIEAAFLPFGGSWGAVEPVSSDTDAASPRIACSNSGEAIAIWQQDSLDQKTSTIQAKVRSAGNLGTWDHPFSRQDGGAGFRMPSVGMNHNGEGVAIWVGLGSGGQWLETALYDPMTEQWSEPAPLGTMQNILQFPQIALNDNGEAVAVWNSQISGKTIVQAAIRNAQGDWSPIHSFSEETSDSLRPSAGIDDMGNALVVWQQGDGSSPTTIKAARFSGSWTTPEVIGTVNP